MTHNGATGNAALVAETLPQPVWTARPDGAVDYANPAWRAYTGFAPEASLGEGWADAVHPDDVTSVLARFRAASAAGAPYEVEYRFRRADGVYRWHAARVAPIRDATGVVVGWVGTAADVDDRVRADAAAALLTAIIESSRDAIFGRALDGTITSWNPGAEELFGYAAAEVVGRNAVVLVPADRRAELADRQARVAAGERVPPFETVRLRKDGSPVEVEVSYSPIVGPDGRIVGISSIDRDVSERHAVRRQQEAFLEAVSHDLRTPLAAITARAQLLGRRAGRGQGLDAAWVAEAAGAIVAAAKRQEAQLGELQDALRLRSGTPLTLARATTDLVALARAAATDTPASPRHRVVVASTEPTVTGRWDVVRIRRVLDNLIGNAVKYSPEGGEVAVAVSRQDRADGAWAVVTVRDAGIGIPAVDLPRLFERYRRGSNVGNRIAGTGIGLAGAKQIVEQHGGSIAVDSAEGRGSTFTVALPLAPVPSAP